jgi:predicted ester cyclase
MSSEENKRLVRRYYEEVFTRRNLAALEELFAVNFLGHSASAGAYTLADMRRVIAQEHEDMPEDETLLEEQIAEGDRVMSRWRYRWKHERSIFGEPPSDEWLTMEGVHVDRLAAGKIVERWEVKDFWGVVRRLGGQVGFAQDERR